MIANSNNFFFECDRSNSNAKIPHATVGRAAPATNRRRQSFTASLTCATRAGSSLLIAAVINTTHKTRPKAFKNIRALINRCPTGEHPFITRDWLFQPSLPCADQQDQRADPFRMMRPPDCLAGAAGFEPLHLEIESAELHPASTGFPTAGKQQEIAAGKVS